MLSSQSRLRPNEEEVAAKVMDGEAILINLSNGIYYSMDKVGGVVWELIEKRHSLEEMTEAITRRYDVASERARADIERLANELFQEHLVLEADDAAAREELKLGSSHEKEAYQPPQLNIYRDMGALLALDPPMPGLEATPWKDSEEEPPK
ncbi:MAG: PqqD family protein [Candidatus Binatia bacterium]